MSVLTVAWTDTTSSPPSPRTQQAFDFRRRRGFRPAPLTVMPGNTHREQASLGAGSGACVTLAPGCVAGGPRSAHGSAPGRCSAELSALRSPGPGPRAAGFTRRLGSPARPGCPPSLLALPATRLGSSLGCLSPVLGLESSHDRPCLEAFGFLKARRLL